MFTIEKNVPIPPPQKNYPSDEFRAKYPWGKMEVGDCFFVPLSDMNKVCAAARVYAKNHGLEFTTRQSPYGVRVW